MAGSAGDPGTNRLRPATGADPAPSAVLRTGDCFDVERVLDERDVPPGRGGETRDVAHPVERLLPAGKHLVHRLGVVEVALVRRKLLGLRPLAQPVADA